MLSDSVAFARVGDSGDLVCNAGQTRPQHIKPHPVETIQQSRVQLEKQLDMTAYRSVYGAHFPMYMQMQEMVFSQVGRAPHMQSSGLALEIFTGNDETIDFEDVLGGEDASTAHVEPHVAMERQLGIQAPRML